MNQATKLAADLDLGTGSVGDIYKFHQELLDTLKMMEGVSSFDELTLEQQEQVHRITSASTLDKVIQTAVSTAGTLTGEEQVRLNNEAIALTRTMLRVVDLRSELSLGVSAFQLLDQMRA